MFQSLVLYIDLVWGHFSFDSRSSDFLFFFFHFFFFHIPSAMDAQYLASLEETLKKTLVPDSNVIKQAEKTLNKDFYASPAALPALVHILLHAQGDEMKQLAAVEARKLVISKWETIDGGLKDSIRQSLLTETFNSSSSPLVRNSCARVVAAVGENDLETGEWNDLLPTLVKGIQELDISTREMATFTLFTLLETQIQSLVPHMEDFLSLFTSLLTREDSNRNIRVNAVLALDAIAPIIEEDTEINPVLAGKFRDSIPGMVQVLKEVISDDDSESTKKVFNVFNSLIFLDTKLVGDHLISLVQLIAEIAANKDLDEEYRTFGLSFLISVVSFRKSKISANKLGPSITLVAVRIASEEIDVDDELNNEHEEQENEESEPPALALRLLAVLSAELPPSQVVTPLFEQLPALLGSSNMFERRGGLLSIGVASSGCPDFFSTQLAKLVPAVTAGLKDSEIVVRVAALKTLTQLTSELQDVIANYHEELLSPIIDNIDSASLPVAYKFACFALDGLIEFMSHEAMKKYIDPLMNKLFHMLQSANSSVLRSAIVSAIGSTAFASGKAFIPYFNNAIQFLEPLLANVTEVEGLSEDDIELKAMTFENISTMARAVGSEAFSAYAKPLIEVAYLALSSEQSRIRESGFAFISNMAKVYGAEFSGFLDQLVPEILKCLEQTEFTFNMDDLDDENEEDLAQGFNVNTGITIEKEIAAVALAELATGTGKDFAKFIEPSFKTLAEQIDTSYGMRESAMQAMFRITKAMFTATMGADFKAPKGVPTQVYVDPAVLLLIQQVRDVAVPLLTEEFELTMVARILDGIADFLFTFGAIALIDDANNTASLESVCVLLMNIIKREHPCQVEDEEGPADEEDVDSSETDALLYESASEVLVNLSLALEGDFNKIFVSFKDVILSQLNSKSKNIRVSATGSLAEIVGGLKQHNQFEQELLQVFIDRVTNDKSLEVKGNCAYGIGLIVENLTSDLTAAYPTVLQLLFQLLNKADKKSAGSDDEETKDVVNRSYANAAGCLARLALKHQQAVPLEHVMGPFLDHLPLEVGFEENVPIFEWIVKLYETENPAIVPQTQRIVDIFAKVFVADAERAKMISESTLGREENADALKQFPKEETRQKVIGLLKFLDSKYNGVVSANEALKGVIA